MPCDRSSRSCSAASSDLVVTTPPSPPARLLVAYSEKHVKSPIDPTLRSPTVASTACAASSITSSECSRAIAHSASMSHGPPAKCTGSTARVRGPTSARTASGSMFSVSASTSANTGVAPACSTAFVVAGHVNDVVITSSPSPSPAATIARCSAAVHDEVAIAWPVPTRAANRSSSSRVRGPLVSQPDRSVSITDAISSSPSTGGENDSMLSRTGVPPSMARVAGMALLMRPRIEPPRPPFALVGAPPAASSPARSRIRPGRWRCAGGRTGARRHDRS